MGWKEINKKNRKRKKISSGSSGDNQTKTPRNGGSPENENTDKIDGISVSDSIRRANSVLFEDNLSMEEPVFVTEESSSVKSHVAQAPTDDNLTSTPVASGIYRDKSSVTNADIMEYLKHMDAKMNAMDSRLKSLDTLEQKVCEIDIDLKKLWNYVHDNIKRTDAKVDTCCDRVENLELSLGMANDKLSQLQKERESMQDDLLYVQSQSMRNNLIFSNIPETPDEGPVQAEANLRTFMHDKLKLAQDLIEQIKFERVHRMGVYNRDSRFPRNIVAKFTLFKDRETVRKQGKELSGTHYSMYEQFPREISQRRKALLPQLKAAKRANKRAWISYDTLYIDGKAVSGNQG